VIAESLALMLATLAVIAPCSYLLRLAWRRGGIPRKVAAAALLGAVALVVWLFASGDAATPVEQLISQFVGAWGLLFMGVGLLVIAAAALGKFRDDPASDDEA
jgi:hypothetical protein